MLACGPGESYKLKELDIHAEILDCRCTSSTAQGLKKSSAEEIISKLKPGSNIKSSEMEQG